MAGEKQGRQMKMENTVRVQFYHMDGRLFRKSYIQHISQEAFESIQQADKGPKVIEIGTVTSCQIR